MKSLDLLKPLIPFLILVVALPLLGLILRAVWLMLRGGPADEAVAYRKVGGILTAAERSFFGVLKSVSPESYQIGFKVRLADIIAPVNGLSKSRRQGALNRIQSKHVDFLICRSDDLSPLLVIELDDASHRRQDQSDRDKVKDAALKSAGIPILRVDCRRGYNPKELRESVLGMIGG
ncbi:MAG: DUF2726 domain-containing protein [Prosthecobacter sp.]|nr:DUF2726 domain-containing protein [Prosthecobacter sp.]